MRCPNCGTENATDAAYCTSCGRDLRIDPGAEPTRPIPPAGPAGEPTVPAMPAAPPPPPTAPIPPVAPGPGGEPPSRGPLGLPAWALGAIVAAAIVAVGLLVWFLVLRDDDAPQPVPPDPGSVTPTVSPSASPSATGPTGTTSTGPTGTTGVTGTTGSVAGDIGVSITMCEDVDAELNCIGEFDYDDTIEAWVIPVTAPSLLTHLTVSDVAPGDVITVEYTDLSTGELAGTVAFDPLPPDVAEAGSWILHSSPATLGTGNTWTAGSTFEMRIFHNGVVVTGFDADLVYTFR